MEITPALIRWYHRHHRDLPWRNTRDPYAIWLSEVILQQTRVEQGRSYYERFLAAYPRLADLAAAREEDVLRLWQGLGYYSRARNLLHTARAIAALPDGTFPASYEGLLALKGIGPYTAAAIASFSFGEQKAVVDGNVLRVLSRLFGVDEPVDSTAGRKRIAAIAAELIPADDPATFNQAIMEFGALQCTPARPDCTACPLAASCEALRTGRVAQLPVKGKRTAVKDVWMTYFFLTENGCTYLRQRTGTGIWKGLFEFPSVVSDQPLALEDALDAWTEEHALTGITVDGGPHYETVHLLSHRRIHARIVRVEKNRMWKKRPAYMQRVALGELHQFGLPRLLTRFLEQRSI